MAGELDIYSSPPIRPRLLDVLRDAEGRVVLDFTAVPFMDSTGLALIIAARHRAEERGLDLIVRASPAVQKVIEVTGLGPYLTLDA